MSPIVKRKKEKFHLASKYWLLILTCVCVLLMVVTFMTNFTGGFLNNIGGYLFKPFQEGISEVGSFLTQKSDELKEMRVLMQENERLREENAALIAENIHLQQYKNELRELQDLLELAAAYEDYETTAARIIAKDTGNWYSSFLINKGTDDGIEVDMNVKNVDYNLSKCCNPQPGDPIFAFVSVLKGIRIHRIDCPNAANIRERYPYRMIPAKWAKKN